MDEVEAPNSYHAWLRVQLADRRTQYGSVARRTADPAIPPSSFRPGAMAHAQQVRTVLRVYSIEQAREWVKSRKGARLATEATELMRKCVGHCLL